MVSKISDSLWVGDYHDACELPLGDYGITHVITMCLQGVEDNIGCTYSHYPIPDGGPDFDIDEHYPPFRNAVNETIQAIRDGETVLVHCRSGQSRSVAVCASVVAVLDDVSLDEARWEVRQKRRIANMSDELRFCASRYVTRHRRDKREGTE